MEQASGELRQLRAELEEATAALSTSQAQHSALEAQVLDLTEHAEAAEATAERVQQELQAAEAASTARDARADALELQLRAEVVAAGGQAAGLQSRLDEAQAEAGETAQRLVSVEGALRVAEAGRRVSADAAEAVRGQLRAAEDAGAALGRVAGLLLLAMHASETRFAASEVCCWRLCCVCSCMVVASPIQSVEVSGWRQVVIEARFPVYVFIGRLFSMREGCVREGDVLRAPVSAGSCLSCEPEAGGV